MHGINIFCIQVGLLVYLAHVGSWIPCEKAVIGITDRLKKLLIVDQCL